jgi:hypothetical protein
VFSVVNWTAVSVPPARSGTSRVCSGLADSLLAQAATVEQSKRTVPVGTGIGAGAGAWGNGPLVGRDQPRARGR